MPSTFFGLNIGVSGLHSFHAAINTTANNLSNVQTTGYSRQTANMSATNAIRVVRSTKGGRSTSTNWMPLRTIRSRISATLSSRCASSRRSADTRSLSSTRYTCCRRRHSTPF